MNIFYKILLIVFCIILLTGCNNSKAINIGKINIMPNEIEKNKLFKINDKIQITPSYSKDDNLITLEIKNISKEDVKVNNIYINIDDKSSGLVNDYEILLDQLLAPNDITNTTIQYIIDNIKNLEISYD